jgi:hypothetical protein
MTSQVELTKQEAARQLLLNAYAINGHIRHPIEARVNGADDPAQSYRKGWEARIGAADDKAAARIVKALKHCGYTPGKPYKHGAKLRVPLYGFDQVERFVDLVNG